MIEEHFNHACTIQTKSSVSDGMGGQTITWTSGTTYKGSIILYNGQNRIKDGVKNATSTHQHLFPYSVALTEANRIVDDSGRTFQVVYVQPSLGNHHKRAELGLIV